MEGTSLAQELHEFGDTRYPDAAKVFSVGEEHLGSNEFDYSWLQQLKFVL